MSAALVLTLSRMMGLRQLIIPSYHPFLFSSVTETRWSELKSVEFGNVTMESRKRATWLLGGNGQFGEVVVSSTSEKADNVSKQSSDIAKHAR